jgi:hypothetical protein
MPPAVVEIFVHYRWKFQESVDLLMQDTESFYDGLYAGAISQYFRVVDIAVNVSERIP